MIHSFKLNGYNVVVDTASGSVHSVDDVAYDIIGMYQGASKDEIVKEITSKYDVTEQDVLDCIDDIEELKKEGKLFSEDTFKPDVDILAKRNTINV